MRPRGPNLATFLLVAITCAATSPLRAQCSAVIDTKARAWFQGIVADGVGTVQIYVHGRDFLGGKDVTPPDTFTTALEQAMQLWKTDNGGVTVGECSGSPNLPELAYQLGDRSGATVPTGKPGIYDIKQVAIQLDYLAETEPLRDETGNFVLDSYNPNDNTITAYGKCPADAASFGIPCTPDGHTDWVDSTRFGQKVLAHEIGHSLNLAHDHCTGSVMLPETDISQLGGAVLPEHCTAANNTSQHIGVSAVFECLGQFERGLLSITATYPDGGHLDDGILVYGNDLSRSSRFRYPYNTDITSLSPEVIGNPNKACTVVQPVPATGKITHDTQFQVHCGCADTGECDSRCDAPLDPVTNLDDHCAQSPGTCRFDGPYEPPGGFTCFFSTCFRSSSSLDLGQIQVSGLLFHDTIIVFESTHCDFWPEPCSTTSGSGETDTKEMILPSTPGTKSTETVIGSGPFTTILLPAQGAVLSGTVTLLGLARDNAFGTGQVALWIDNQPAPVQNLTWGQPAPDACVDLPGAPATGCNQNMKWSATLDTYLLSNGTHRLQIVSANAESMQWPPITYAERSFQVDNCLDKTRPTATLDSPLPGASLTGSVDVSGTFTDDVGVTRVDLLVDGAQVASDFSAPFGFSWDSSTVPIGDHTLELRARDACDNRGRSGPITVSVWNPIPGGPAIRVEKAGDGTRLHSGDTVVYPDTEAGAAESLLFTITNDGDSPLDLVNPTSLVSGSCWTQIDPFPVASLASGSATSFRVRVLCGAFGVQTGTVTIQSNDPDDSVFQFMVQATVRGPDIRVAQSWDGVTVASGSTQQFPSVAFGSSTSNRYAIHNEGVDTLTLGNAGSLVSGACFQQIETPSTSVAPGAVAYFRVRLSCTTPGTHTGTVSIESNDQDESPYTFLVQGTVLPPPDIRVDQAWNDVTVASGTTQQFPTLDYGGSSSKRYVIHNDGEGTLDLTNPGGLVSGTCFQEIETPTASVPPGGTAYFRVRFYCTDPGTHTGTVSIGSDDPDESPFTFNVTGTMRDPVPDIRIAQASDGTTVVAGTTQQFPTLVYGGSDSFRYAIHNDGQGTLNLTNPTALVSGACFREIETPTASVAAGGVAYFRVQFYCTSAGTHTGTVSVSSDDPDESPYSFFVRGTMLAPADIGVSHAWDGVSQAIGSTFTFPSVEVGTSTSRQFAIHNNGTSNLYISNPTSIVSGTCFQEIETPSSTVPPGGSTYVRVRLFCSSGGIYIGTVSISSNDPDESPYWFRVAGTVDEPPPDIAVVKAWNGYAIANGGSFTFPSVAAGTATSRRFGITNSGSGALSLSNATSLVSGTCFQQVETPSTPIAVGGTGYVRIRVLCSTPGSYTGHLRIYSNDPDENPYSITLYGTVTQ